MATNPMQRKSRNAFLLGMVITLLIAAVIVVLLYMKIQNQQEELETYKLTTSSVYVLNQDVVSGQVLTMDMFTPKEIATSTIPANSTTDIVTTLSSYSLSDTEGRPIYISQDESGLTYYFIRINDTDYTIYTTDSEGTEQVARNLTTEDAAYYYAGANNTNRTNITVASNAIVAKVDLRANTVITTSLIARADERTTNDLREMEYNIISLPVDLITGEYVDIRLALPTGEDFIVVSKKQVTVPVSNGTYLADTIQLNLTEKEILMMSCAIVENYQMEGSKLYAVKYTEAGLQEGASETYYPNNNVVQLVNNNPNIVNKAWSGIEERRSSIDQALSTYGDEDNISTEVEGSITSSQEAREDYLQSLTATTTTAQ